MLVFELCIQINGQISIPRNWLKVKLHYVISLGLGLKRVKITRKVTKVGMHACLSNRHPNLQLNFNFEKLVKRETLSCSFTMVWLKGGINTSENGES